LTWTAESAEPQWRSCIRGARRHNEMAQGRCRTPAHRSSGYETPRLFLASEPESPSRGRKVRSLGSSSRGHDEPETARTTHRWRLTDRGPRLQERARAPMPTSATFARRSCSHSFSLAPASRLPRSKILHGSDLMQLDQDRAFGWDPPWWNEHEMNQELWNLRGSQRGIG
jgi:hypothetical protein